MNIHVIIMNHYHVVMTCMRRATKEEFEVKIDVADPMKLYGGLVGD